jgi:hypothetical protein
VSKPNVLVPSVISLPQGLTVHDRRGWPVLGDDRVSAAGRAQEFVGHDHALCLGAGQHIGLHRVGDDRVTEKGVGWRKGGVDVGTHDGVLHEPVTFRVYLHLSTFRCLETPT